MGEAVAAEFVTMRDSGGQSPLLPPGDTIRFEYLGAPAHEAGSFLYSPENSIEIADGNLVHFLSHDLEENLTNRHRLLRFALPPTELRAQGFRNLEEIMQNRFPTPVDERGLVDVDLLIEMVKSTVHPNYRWPGYSDRHHTLWPAYRYGIVQTFVPELDAVAFRNLAINKIWVPRVFHNWTHIVTQEPEVPPEEIMQESIEEWAIVRDFFISVKETTKIMRIYERERVRRAEAGMPLTASQEEMIADDLRRRLGGVVLHFKGLEGLNLNRWPISMNMSVHTAAGQVGDLVMRGWQRRTKQVRRLPEMLADTQFLVGEMLDAA